MKKSVLPIRGIILSLFVVFIFAGCGGGGGDDVSSGVADRYTSLDLDGTWSMHGVNTGLTLATNRGGYYGEMTMTTSGNVTSGTMYFYGYVGMQNLLGSMNIDEDGFLGGTLNTSSFSFVIESGLMDPSKESMIYIDHTTHATTEYDLAILIKEGGSFPGTSIQGDWHMLGLCTQAASTAKSGSIYGPLTISAIGTPSGTFTQRGTLYNITSGSITVDSSGFIPSGDTLIVDTPATWTITSGKLDQSRTFGVFTSSNTLLTESDMVVIIKEASLLSVSDLAGKWYIYGATGGAVVNGTISGTIYLNSAGTVTGGSIAIPGDVERTINSGALSVTNTGTLTGSFVLSSAATITIQYGRMDQSRNKMAFTDTGDKNLYILSK